MKTLFYTIFEDKTRYKVPSIKSDTRFTYPSAPAVDKRRSTTALLSSAVPTNKGNI